ncbi:hypothetical protein CDAR_554461 [Caerostris darwini]|uniref:Uncharacterized protein n=1 Tax=Caerostris darwini TaxID=1538125 RepID=A0AAV4SKL5_9ARAC|nr:hypothetical protein CDAR_554461 [Caerostris darwini]
MAYINETRHISSAPSDLHSVKNTSAAHTCTTFRRRYIFCMADIRFSGDCYSAHTKNTTFDNFLPICCCSRGYCMVLCFKCGICEILL